MFTHRQLDVTLSMFFFISGDQGLYLSQQARQLQATQAAVAASRPQTPAAVLIQNEAQIQRSISQHSPTVARVPLPLPLAPVSQNLVSIIVDNAHADTSDEAELLYWHDISSLGKEEGMVSSSGRFVAHALVGLFALFYLMHEYSSGDYSTWPIRSDTNNIRTSWWWTFAPLLVLNFCCLLTFPSLSVTLSRNGFVVTARRASQRSGFLALALFGNPFLLVSELVLISNLSEPSSRHISYTAFYVFAPCLIGSIFLILGAIVALVSTSSQSVKAPSVSLFAGVCLATFCIMCPLRIGGQVEWSWWIVMCPMYLICLLWAVSAFISLLKITQKDPHNHTQVTCTDSVASIYHTKWSINSMLLIDSICFGIFFAILAAVLEGGSPLNGNLRLAILPVYAASGINCLTFIVSSCVRSKLPSWAIMTDVRSIGSDCSHSSSPSISSSSGSPFVEESFLMRTLHVIVLVLLAFQVCIFRKCSAFEFHSSSQAIFLASKFDSAVSIGQGGVWTSGWQYVAVLDSGAALF
jgi:hypothetical protein